MSIHKKLFDLRKEIKPLVKDTQGYNYKYFDINQMIRELQPLLEKHNLLLVQPLTDIGGKMALTTRIQSVENSEDYVETTTPLIELQDPQKQGAVITYFRRYALQSLLFLEAEDDDAASTKPKMTKPNSKEAKQPPF